MTSQAHPNEVIAFQMADGEVGMTLQMLALYKVRAKNRDVWARYNDISSGRGKDGELDIAFVLYTAYLCACEQAGEADRYGSFEGFLENLPSDRFAMRDAYQEMTGQKKA